MGFTALVATAATLAQATGDFSTSPWPFIILFGAGFGIGVLGHLYGSRLVVAFGIVLVFLATLVLPFVLSLSN